MKGYTKLIKSGDYIEIYKYEKDYTPKKIPFRKQRAKRVVGGVFRRKRNVAQSRRTFLRLVWANLQREERPAFLTLTMLQVMALQDAYKELTAFFARFRRIKGVGERFRYISVPEFQKRGAVHFHVLIWGLPASLVENERTTRYIQRQWLRGFCDIFWTDGSSKIAGYLAKYMSKAMQDNRLYNQKAYSASRNLMRSVSFSGPVQSSYFDDILDVDNLVLDKEFEYPTMWLGRANYKRYKSVSL